MKHGGRGVIVWGVFLAVCIGEVFHCAKSFNALEYRRILQNDLLPTNEKLSKEEWSDVIFQQDNAPEQIAQKNNKKKNSSRSIRLMFLPWSESRSKYLVLH